MRLAYFFWSYLINLFFSFFFFGRIVFFYFFCHISPFFPKYEGGGGNKQSVGKCVMEEEDKGEYIYLHFSCGMVDIFGRRGFEKMCLLLIEGYIYFYFSAIE